MGLVCMRSGRQPRTKTDSSNETTRKALQFIKFISEFRRTYQLQRIFRLGHSDYLTYAPPSRPPRQVSSGLVLSMTPARQCLETSCAGSLLVMPNTNADRKSVV